MHEVKAGTGKESAPIAAVDEAAHVICRKSLIPQRSKMEGALI